MVPTKLPESVRDDADDYRKQLAAAENDRLLAAEPQDRVSTASCATTATRSPSARRRSAGQLKKAADDGARRSRSRSCRPEETELIALYQRIGEVLQISPKTIHKRVIRGIADAPYSNVTIRTDVPRAQFNYMREQPEYFPGVVVDEALPAPLSERRARGAAVRARLRDRPGAAQ